MAADSRGTWSSSRRPLICRRTPRSSQPTTDHMASCCWQRADRHAGGGRVLGLGHRHRPTTRHSPSASRGRGGCLAIRRTTSSLKLARFRHSSAASACDSSSLDVIVDDAAYSPSLQIMHYLSCRARKYHMRLGYTSIHITLADTC